jgi:hypothetical protein
MRPLLLILTITLLTGCEFKFGDDYTLGESTFDDKALQTVSRVSGLQLPEGTRGLNMVYLGSGIDDALIAKLQIPASHAFQLTTQIKALSGRTTSAIESLAQGKAWWNQDALDIKVHRQLDVKNDYLEVILGQEGSTWILLVKWFST